MNDVLPRGRTLTLALALLLCPGRVAAQPVAVLPVDAPAALEDTVEQELERLSRSRSIAGLIAPSSLRARLGPSDARLAAQALARITAAEEATLYMQRERALAEARRAIALLEPPQGRLHHRELLSRAEGALAVGLLLDPPDDGAAIEAFRRALEAAPDHLPSRERMTPMARRLLEQARERWAIPRLPPPGLVTTFARALQVTRLVWVSARALPGSSCRMEVILLDPQGLIVRRAGVDAVAASERGAALERLLQQLLSAMPSTRASTTAPSSTAPSSTPSSLPDRPRPSRPRRRTWIVGGVAMAALASGVGLSIAAELDQRAGRTAYEERDRTRWESLRSASESKALAANILFGVGGGLAVTALVLFFVERRAGASPPSDRRASRGGVRVLPTAGGIVLDGGF